MRSGVYKTLITGGAGFIGSAFVRLAAKKGYPLVVMDKLTYAGDLARLAKVEGQYKFYKADISDKAAVEDVFRKENPEALVNFSAETHVDRSIIDSRAFIETNVIGTHVLLDTSRKYKIKRFIHISTDEVYGEIAKGRFTEKSALRPSSPYAASKAAADLLIKSYIRTYGFPAIIVRPCNNYGPWQYPEKLIPLAILKIIKKQKVPVYAKGRNVREWLYVDDCAEGIMQVLKKGKIGETYNLGSSQERQNIEVVRKILDIMRAPAGSIEFVKDRPGHDIRYRLNSGKVFHALGWQPKTNLSAGLQLTVAWCVAHRQWLLSKWRSIAPIYNVIK